MNSTSLVPAKKTKLPSDLLLDQKLTYGELVRAKVIARSKSASTKDKIYAAVLQQRRDERTKALRASFKVIG